MITTVCMNPSFDKTVEIPCLQPGELNRIQKIRQDPGGKGLNVAVVLHRLGVEAGCVGFLGEESRPSFLKLLEKEGVSFQAVPLPGEVRTNLKVVDCSSGRVTELNEPGPEVDPPHLEAFFALLRQAAGESDLVVFSGSLPRGCEGSYARGLRELSGVRCVLDCAGSALREALPQKPFLIKPNRAELEELAGRRLSTLAEIQTAARELMALGAENVIVSLGKEGALLLCQDLCLFAPEVETEVHSTVGAGDAMLAGVVAALEKGEDLPEAFRWGVAAGTASVMTDGTQLIRLEDYQRLLPRVRVEKL